jgi:hypothetical protein
MYGLHTIGGCHTQQLCHFCLFSQVQGNIGQVGYILFGEITWKDLVEECGAILEFVDVHVFHCSATELLAAVLSCLPNFLVFGVSFVDGLGLFHLDYCCIFGNIFVTEAKTFGNGS